MANVIARFACFSSVSLMLFSLFLSGCVKSDLAEKPSVDKGQNGSKIVEQKKTDAEKNDTEKHEPKKHALLVACSTYDHLPVFSHLRGPNNDVVFMRIMLKERFGYTDEDIKILADDGESMRPLKANIENQFTKLIKEVKQKDQVVIYLSGHGSQQPDDDPDNADDPEPDGLDEVFCPADVKSDVHGGEVSIVNGISDDQFRTWLDQIRAQNASVWFIVDACHSGTLTRGARTYRQIAPEELLSREVLAAAKPKASTRGFSAENQPSAYDTNDNEGGIVALYASQPHEPTFEAPMPPGSDRGVLCGIMTYHLVKVVMGSDDPLSYDELVKRIHAEYVALGLPGPLPLVEGSDRKHEILGNRKWPQREGFVLLHRGNQLRINAGSLQGLTLGSIMAVYPPAGDEKEGDKPIGHAKIEKIAPSATLLTPCAFGEFKLVGDLPLGGRCEVVYLDYGDLSLSVAVRPDETADAEVNQKLTNLVKEFASEENTIVSFTEDPATADWLLVPLKDGTVVLSPGVGSAEDSTNLEFGPVEMDDDLGKWLDDRLHRIAKASNLLRIGAKTSSQKNSSIFGTKFPRHVKVELLKLKSATDKEGTLIRPGSNGIALKEGELISVRVHNTGYKRVDVSMLFVDSGYGIDSIYPKPGTVADNRIEPQDSITIGPMRVEDSSLGQEHLVVIAVVSQGQPLDFSWIAQDTIEKAKTRSGSSDGLDSPIGQLLQKAVFASGTTRGAGVVSSRDVSIDLVSWQTSK